MDERKIDNVFIQHASNVLGDTNAGLSGVQIIECCVKYAIEFNVSIPITSSDFRRFGSMENSNFILLKNFVSHHILRVNNQHMN